MWRFDNATSWNWLFRIRRREFITLIGAAAAACPHTARGQQPERIRLIGIILPNKDDPDYRLWINAFRQGLQGLGWIEGRNVRLDIRWGTENPAEIRKQAAELAALAPDVILAAGTSTVGPLMQATRTVPSQSETRPSFGPPPRHLLPIFLKDFARFAGLVRSSSYGRARQRR